MEAGTGALRRVAACLIASMVVGGWSQGENGRAFCASPGKSRYRIEGDGIWLLCFSAPEQKCIASATSDQQVYPSTTSSSSYTLSLIFSYSNPHFLKSRHHRNHNLLSHRLSRNPLPLLSNPRTFIVVNPSSTLLSLSPARHPHLSQLPKTQSFHPSPCFCCYNIILTFTRRVGSWIGTSTDSLYFRLAPAGSKKGVRSKKGDGKGIL